MNEVVTMIIKIILLIPTIATISTFWYLVFASIKQGIFTTKTLEEIVKENEEELKNTKKNLWGFNIEIIYSITVFLCYLCIDIALISGIIIIINFLINAIKEMNATSDKRSDKRIKKIKDENKINENIKTVYYEDNFGDIE